LAKLYFRHASMNSGKSTALLQAACNYEENQKSVLLFTSAVDTRYGVGMITSRLGVQRAAVTFDTNFDFSRYYQDNGPVDCILIDEAQFLTTTQVKDLHQLAHACSVPVMAYGLRADFMGNPFPGTIYLMALAETIEEMKSICHCGRKATMNMRIDGNGEMVTKGDQIEIGGNDRYRQVCAHHFYTKNPGVFKS
jgi:thymidine kinase